MENENHNYNVRDLKYIDPNHLIIDALLDHPDFGEIPYTYDTQTPDESLDEHIKAAIESGVEVLPYEGSDAEKSANEFELSQQIKANMDYLNSTDWVLAKMLEEQMFGNQDEVEQLKIKYSSVIDERRSARLFINENETRLDVLELQ